MIAKINAVMPAREPSSWPNARWIGTLDIDDLPALAPRIRLSGCEGAEIARFLVRRGPQVRGFVEIPMHESAVSRDALHAACETLPAVKTSTHAGAGGLSISIGVPTTGERRESLAAALTSMQAVDYPYFDVIVVENSSYPRAADLVGSFDDARFRYVHTTARGTSAARNRVVLESTSDVIAFTDDDVIVDKFWLLSIAAAFIDHPRAGVVTGMVPSGQLVSYSQGYFEDRIEWNTSPTLREFRLDNPPPDVPLFPYEIRDYGTGANFACRRSDYLLIGGSNEALGGGTPAKGGEDQDLFLRFMFRGASLVYQPDSIVWHQHRRDSGALASQLRGYGRGMGALLTVQFVSRRSVVTALRVMVRAIPRLVAMGRTSEDRQARGERQEASHRRDEVLGLLSGPFFYLVSRLGGRRPRPLAKPRVEAATST